MQLSRMTIIHEEKQSVCVQVVMSHVTAHGPRVECACDTAVELAASPAPKLAALFGIACIPHSQPQYAVVKNTLPMQKLPGPALCTT